MKTSSLERKDPDVFWIRVRFLVKVDLQYIPFLLNWCSWMTTLSNLKTYLPFALKHLFGCHFKHLWKKRKIIVTFQSGQLTEQPKTLDDLGRFDLKMFRNFPIRIEIITGSHIFILFLPRVVSLCLHFTPRCRSR
jgi:hypothetical protein